MTTLLYLMKATMKGTCVFSEPCDGKPEIHSNFIWHKRDTTLTTKTTDKMKVFPFIGQLSLGRKIIVKQKYITVSGSRLLMVQQPKRTFW